MGYMEGPGGQLVVSANGICQDEACIPELLFPSLCPLLYLTICTVLGVTGVTINGHRLRGQIASRRLATRPQGRIIVLS